MPMRHVPGDWTALTTDSCWAVVGLRASHEHIPAFWTSLESSDPISSFLAVAVNLGFRDMPGFAIVNRTPQGFRYVVRAPAELELTGPGDRRTVILAEQSPTWLDAIADTEPVSLRMRSKGFDAPGRGLPIGGGVLGVGWLEVDLAEAPSPAAQPEPLVPEGSAHSDPQLAAKHLAPTGLSALLPEPEPDPESELNSELKSTLDSAPGVDPRPDAGRDLYYRLVVSNTMDRDQLLASLTENAETDASEDQQPTGETPAEDPLPSDRTATWPESTGLVPEREASHEQPPPLQSRPEVTPPVAPPTAPGSRIIDGLPWDRPGSTPPVTLEAGPAPIPTGQPPASTPSARPSEPAPTFDTSEDDGAMTQSRAQILAALTATAAVTGPTVLANYCPAGHANPVVQDLCRACGATIQEQTPVRIVRPSLGRLALSTGDAVPLDRDAVLGRSPRSDEVDPAKRPNLVKVGASLALSRIHAVVHLDDWQVLVRDLGSDNGTFVTMPGGEPERLRPNQDVPLAPGAMVSLADEVTFSYEVT